MIHTPGPWKVDSLGKITRAFKSKKNGVVIEQAIAVVSKSTYVAGDYIRTPPNTLRGNGHLIAAAPEMLKQLRICASQCGDCVRKRDPKCVICSDLWAVIHKAEGK
jgi:hypothetical protein